MREVKEIIKEIETRDRQGLRRWARKGNSLKKVMGRLLVSGGSGGDDGRGKIENIVAGL